MADVVVRHIAISEDNFVNTLFRDDLFKIRLVFDAYAFRIELASQIGRVAPAFDVRNLCPGERDHLVRGVVAKYHIEVMEVASGCAEY